MLEIMKFAKSPSYEWLVARTGNQNVSCYIARLDNIYNLMNTNELITSERIGYSV